MSVTARQYRLHLQARSLGRWAAGARAAMLRLPLAAIVALAAVLRWRQLGAMQLDPYYDAAVRSMGTSWHAFLVGAFEPGASVAIDKPPLDLWLQVATTKLFGFTPVALLAPEALASTLAVVLLYDLVRRCFGRLAGLGAAAALAVLPVEVITGRSDTMDGVMMALLVLAAWLIVRAMEKGRARELYAAAAVLGLAFETKLFEALVPLPALLVLFLLGSRAPWRRRAAQLAVSGGVMVAVGLAWTVAFALIPAGHRPYPMGSTNGSVWNTVFVYNGIGRLSGTSIHTVADRLAPPGATRLLSGGPVHLDLLVGEVLVAAVAFAIAAVAHARADARRRARLPFALAVALGVWTVVGVAVLSVMQHMPERYLEVLTPAIAGVLGIGVASACSAAVHAVVWRARAGALPRAGAIGVAAAAVASSLVYAHGAGKLPLVALLGAAGAAILLGLAWLVVGRTRASARVASSVAALTTALVLLSVLAAPASESFALQRAHTADGGVLGGMPAPMVSALSKYLTSHRDGRRYEFASYDAALAGPVIVADGQPVLILAASPYHQLVSVAGLQRATRTGAVRYVLLGRQLHARPVQPPGAKDVRDQIRAWVIRHGVDVSRAAGLAGYGVLYRVAPGAAG
jgi:4-amino-4-deoxy-L-arabinose transferase-like glycosyltransferase